MYLAIGQAKKAIPDLDKTVQLKTDFHQVGERGGAGRGGGDIFLFALRVDLFFDV